MYESYRTQSVHRDNQQQFEDAANHGIDCRGEKAQLKDRRHHRNATRDSGTPYHFSRRGIFVVRLRRRPARRLHPPWRIAALCFRAGGFSSAAAVPASQCSSPRFPGVRPLASPFVSKCSATRPTQLGRHPTSQALEARHNLAQAGRPGNPTQNHAERRRFSVEVQLNSRDEARMASCCGRRNMRPRRDSGINELPLFRGDYAGLAMIGLWLRPKRSCGDLFPRSKKISSQNSSIRGSVCPTLGKTDMDTFDSTQRSDIMRRVRSSGTQPEMIVRSIVRRMGVHYRSCLRNLPGKPDLVIPNQRKAILVHGCFWHGHCCEAGV